MGHGTSSGRIDGRIDRTEQVTHPYTQAENAPQPSCAASDAPAAGETLPEQVRCCMRILQE